MTVLSLVPRGKTVVYAACERLPGKPALTGLLPQEPAGRLDRQRVMRTLAMIKARCLAARPRVRPEMIAIRAVYGGNVFRAPVVFGPHTRAKLEGLVSEAPLETVALTLLAEACQSVFDRAAIVLVFETSFFMDLPTQERNYALDPRQHAMPSLRRFGFHGISHEAACRFATTNLSPRSNGRPPRLLSICLDTNPELAAVSGNHPLMTTAGSSPLEGLPGRTSCGDLDPGIVLAIAREKGWGPEEINMCLTQRSGLAGLSGARPVLLDLFATDAAENTKLAREVFEYRLLLACGAGRAALGGVDALVFSGRYAQLGKTLAAELLPRLSGNRDGCRAAPAGFVLKAPLSALVADRALSECAALRHRTAQVGGKR